MTQEISKATTSNITLPPEKNVYEQYAEQMSRQRIIGDLLKFSKGEWLAGRDGELIDEGAELVAGCDGLEIGWTKWQDFKPVEFRMGLLSQGFVPAKRNELPDQDPLMWPRDETSGQPRDPWQASNTLVLMDAETKGLYTFAAASKGALGAVGRLMGIYGKHIRQAPDMLPVVALMSDSYKHSNKAFGRIAFPVLKVTGWVPRAPFDAALAGAILIDGEAEAEEGPPMKPTQDYVAVKGRRGRPPRRRDDEDVPF